VKASRTYALPVGPATTAALSLGALAVRHCDRSNQTGRWFSNKGGIVCGWYSDGGIWELMVF
jgi:hypothetical protein